VTDFANLNFDSYQNFTDTVSKYPSKARLTSASLGLIGEAGEFAEKLLPLIAAKLHEGRDPGLSTIYHKLSEIIPLAKQVEQMKKDVREGRLPVEPLPDLTQDQKDGLVKELGDVLWYVARAARGLDLPMSEIARVNAEKLASRAARGVLHGSGDNR
jgi:NTP pyrophosphatase (non-canonical NTP hydrolase)